MCSNFSALVVFSPTYLISKAPFGRTKHTHTFVVFPIINFTVKKVQMNPWAFKDDKNKIPQTEPFTHSNSV